MTLLFRGGCVPKNQRNESERDLRAISIDDINLLQFPENSSKTLIIDMQKMQVLTKWMMTSSFNILYLAVRYTAIKLEATEIEISICFS